MLSPERNLANEFGAIFCHYGHIRRPTTFFRPEEAFSDSLGNVVKFVLVTDKD